MFARRLPPGRMYPAGDSVVTARDLALPSGDVVRVAEAGPRDGRAVLLLHGWAASLYSWRYVLPALARAGHRAVAVDLRGHGLSSESPAAAAYSTEAMVRHVCEIADALALDMPVVVGHSMSGRIALEYARFRPTRVAALGLIAPAGVSPLRITKIARPVLALAAWLGPWAVPRLAVAVIMRAVWGKRSRPNATDVDQYWAPSQFPRYERAIDSLLRDFDWSVVDPATLASVPVPLTIVLGECDPLLGVRDATALAAAVAPQRVVEIARVGHIITDEAPEQTIAELLSLIRDSSHAVSKGWRRQ